MDNFYVSNYLKNNNIVFECTAFDISSNFNFLLNYIDNEPLNKFGDVSATAVLDISASVLDNIFMFQDDMNGEYIYGIKKKILNLNYSNAKIIKIINNQEVITDKTITQDYIESIIKTMLGVTTNNPEYFLNNTTQINNYILSKDLSFNNILNNIIETYSDPSLNDNTLNIYKKPPYNVLELQCRSLITGILNVHPDAINRRIKFLQDISNQTLPNQGINQVFYFKFNPGDRLGIRIIYNSIYNNININNISSVNRISYRSYKIFLNIIS